MSYHWLHMLERWQLELIFGRGNLASYYHEYITKPGEDHIFGDVFIEMQTIRIARLYRDDLMCCNSIEDLHVMLDKWWGIAPDAYVQGCFVDKYNWQVFKEFRDNPEFQTEMIEAGEDWWASIVCPMYLIDVSIIASEFTVPEGMVMTQLINGGGWAKSTSGCWLPARLFLKLYGIAPYDQKETSDSVYIDYHPA